MVNFTALSFLASFSIRMINMNKVILIGGDHYNGLSLVRLFGKQGLKPHGLIIGPSADKGFLRASKYWEHVDTLESNEGIVDYLLTNYSMEEEVPVVIPWSDGAADAIDSSLDVLGEKFTLPSISGRQGALSALMDKASQVAFADNCGLRTAQTVEVKLEDGIIPDVPYPCIGKPVSSIEGKKRDIRRMDTKEELDEYLTALRDEGYSRILIQEFLDVNAEYDVEGYVNGNDACYYSVRKYRTWPNVGGPTAYAVSDRNDALDAVMTRVLNYLKAIGYSGLFDVELFKVGDSFLFNEINWRNSAVCFAAVAAGINYPLYWYESVCGRDPGQPPAEENGRTAICELLDMHNARKVGVATWLRQLSKSDAYAYYDSSDMAPVRQRFQYSLASHIKRSK